MPRASPQLGKELECMVENSIVINSGGLAYGRERALERCSPKSQFPNSRHVGLKTRATVRKIHYKRVLLPLVVRPFIDPDDRVVVIWKRQRVALMSMEELKTSWSVRLRVPMYPDFARSCLFVGNVVYESLENDDKGSLLMNFLR